MERRSRRRNAPSNHKDYARTDSRAFGRGSDETVASEHAPVKSKAVPTDDRKRKAKKQRTGQMILNSSNSIVSKNEAQMTEQGW